MSHHHILTTADGAPIADNQNALTAGSRGPLLMQDVQLLEQMQHFNRERIPERVVHAKGSGAYGTFTVTNDVTRYTRAAFLSEVGKRTETFLRFSTVAGERGAADAERDVRGFALKFYTEQGNWDMVGNNTPVFFVRDPYKFAQFIHTQKRHPQTNLRDMNAQWDFWSLCPESLHQVTILFSDRGLPRSYRHLNGYGSHTYSLINADGERVWCKFHFKTLQGIECLSETEAGRIDRKGPRASPARPLRGHRVRRLPPLALFRSGDDRGAGRGISLEPLRPHEGLAARRFPAHRGGHSGAQPQSGKLLCRGGAGVVQPQCDGPRH